MTTHSKFTTYNPEPGSKVHLVGIKGVAMTALAQILQSRGVRVTGSDGPDKFFTDKILRKLKITYKQKFSADNLKKDIDAVISSAAYLHNGKVLNNVEVEAAIKKKIPIYTYPEVMSALTAQYRTLAVAGSHGKSTTSGLLAWVLVKCGVDPTAIIGSRVNKWNTNGRVGKSQTLVIEADEYREAFLKYAVSGAIVTSIDYDHPDYFKTRKSYILAFRKFVERIALGGFLVVFGDDQETKKLGVYARLKDIRTISYGFDEKNDVVLIDKGVSRQTNMFTIMFNGQKYSGKIPFVGKQYVLNSGAVFAMCVALGVNPKVALSGISTFPGIARRFETVKKTKDYVIIDDYAHHPTAINITLEGIRAMYPKRHIVAVFQPHMFSRTEVLLEPFAKSFNFADEVGIMEIYPSAREKTGPVKGRDLAARAKFYHRRVTYLPDMESGKQYVKQHAKDNNVIVLMGAGNVNELA